MNRDEKLSIKRQCKLLEVCRSSFYYIPQQESFDNQELMKLIDKQYMETPFWTVDTLFYTELKEDINPKFIYYVFQTIPWKKYNEASGVPSLSKPNIHNIATILLPYQEQKQIAEILSTADEKLEVLRAKKEKYETLKKGLLQKLLSGEVRV